MANKKPLVHTKKGCGELYEIYYNDDNLPYLQCVGCQHKLEDWINWHRTYSSFYLDDTRWDNKQDHMVCLLGYFVARYKQHYNVDFSLSLNENGLFRGQEITILRRIYQTFSGDAVAAKHYINWFFEEQVQRRKKRLTSISVLATPALLNEYKLHLNKQRVVTRDRKIPPGMIRWINDFTPGLMEHVSIQDYGDLNLLLKHYKTGHMSGVADVDLFVKELKRQKVVNENCDINNWSN